MVWRSCSMAYKIWLWKIIFLLLAEESIARAARLEAVGLASSADGLHSKLA